MTRQLSTPHRPLMDTAHLLTLALLLVGAVLVVGLYLASQPIAMTATSAAASSGAPISQRLAPTAQTLRANCGVTGDLVGDANPADIAAAMCGGRR